MIYHVKLALAVELYCEGPIEMCENAALSKLAHIISRLPNKVCANPDKPTNSPAQHFIQCIYQIKRRYQPSVLYGVSQDSWYGT